MKKLLVIAALFCCGAFAAEADAPKPVTCTRGAEIANCCGEANCAAAKCADKAASEKPCGGKCCENKAEAGKKCGEKCACPGQKAAGENAGEKKCACNGCDPAKGECDKAKCGCADCKCQPKAA